MRLDDEGCERSIVLGGCGMLLRSPLTLGCVCVASLMSCDERMDGKVVRDRVGAEADLVNLAHLRGTHELFDITQTSTRLRM